MFVQYGIYRGVDIAANTAYWHNYDHEPLVSGLGDVARAHINQPGQPYFELYVLKGMQVLRLLLFFTGSTTKSADQIDGMYVAVAQAIAARMAA